MDTPKVIEVLNRILELELAGVVRYTHYSLMVFGHARIPIIGWMTSQANEGLLHARSAGELVTSLGGHPSLRIGRLTETRHYGIDDILHDSLEHEREAVGYYRRLLELVRDQDVRLEEYARQMIAHESDHISEVEKMLRKPGELKPAT